ncbi:MAG: hypothetical protein SFU27_13655 [Thermonemataceae bacterium]|nr:hypothetical protein [Thermonemataceae bacterium]
MKNIIFLIVLYSIMSEISFAQYSKTFSIGGGIGYTLSKYNENNLPNRISELSISPNIVSGITDRWSVGAGYEYRYQRRSYYDTLMVIPEAVNLRYAWQGASIFIHYYYPFNKKIGFTSTLKGSFLLGNSLEEYLTQRIRYREQNTKISIGLMFFPTKKIALEANFNLISYQYNKTIYIYPASEFKSTTSGFTIIGSTVMPAPQIGLRYYFLKK